MDKLLIERGRGSGSHTDSTGEFGECGCVNATLLPDTLLAELLGVATRTDHEFTSDEKDSSGS